MVEVVVVDGQALGRAALSAWLDNSGSVRVRGEAECVESALRAVDRLRPGVLVVDWRLEQRRGDGGEGAREMRALAEEVSRCAPSTRLVALSTRSESERHREMVLWGVRGLVCKEEPPETLLRAIERVHAGEMWLARELLAQVVHGLRRQSEGEEPHRKRLASLTRREREIVLLIGAGQNNRAIARELFITETTVRHHLTSAFAKLGVRGRLECALFALKHADDLTR